MSNNVTDDLAIERRIARWSPLWISTAFLGIGIFMLLYVLSIQVTPCGNVAHAQAQCSVGDDETFTGSTTFEGEINVGATPNAGSSSQVLTSQGDGVVPEWANIDQPILQEVLASDEIRNNTAAVATMGWSFTATANKTYVFEINAIFDDNGGATDIDYTWSLPSGTFNSWASGPGGLVQHDTASGGTEITLTTNNVTDGYLQPIRGVIEVGGTGGTVDFQWAQSSALAVDTTMRTGSTIGVFQYD